METERWQHMFIDAEWDSAGKLEKLTLTTPDGVSSTHPIDPWADAKTPDPLALLLNTFGHDGWNVASVDFHHYGGGEDVRRIWMQRRVS